MAIGVCTTLAWKSMFIVSHKPTAAAADEGWMDHKK